MLTAFATVLAFVGVAAALIVGSRLLGRALRPPSVPTEEAAGEPREVAADVQVPRLTIDARFGLVAVVLVGVEGAIAILVPVAVVLRRWVTQGHGVRALIEVLAFAGVLLVGVACAWRKGDLVSARDVGAPEKEPSA